MVQIPSPSHRSTHWRARLVVSIAAATLVYAGTAGCRGTRPDSNAGESVPKARAAKLQRLFGNWLSEWQRIDSRVTLDRFRQESQAPWVFTPQYEFDPTSEWAQRTSGLRLPSPDSTLAIHPWMRCEITEREGRLTCAGCEPDVSAALFDLRSQRWSEIMGCGTPCLYDDAGWIGDRTVVVASQVEYYPQDGPLYPDTVVVVPYFHVFDLAESTMTSYRGPAVPAAKVERSAVRNYATRRMNELLAGQ